MPVDCADCGIGQQFGEIERLHSWAAGNVQHLRVFRNRCGQAQSTCGGFAIAWPFPRKVAVNVPENGAGLGIDERHRAAIL